MKNTINNVHLEGYLYSHTLEVRVSKSEKNPGVQYITGNVDIAIDDAMLNVVPVHFTYVIEKTSKGNPNATYETLNNIINGSLKSATVDGADVATKLRIDTSVGLNEFYSDRSGTEEFVSVKRNEGGFVHTAVSIAEDEKKRNKFECDMLITSVIHNDANEQTGTPEKAIVKGCIFDFRNAVLPVEFSAVSEGAIRYFEGLNATPNTPVFTKVWGSQISETIVHREVEKSAFGMDEVKETVRSRKDWVITGAATEPYAWDDESTITGREFVKLMGDREVYVSTLKQRNDEFKARKNGASASTAANSFSPTSFLGGFNF